jgi:hypothetical protein
MEDEVQETYWGCGNTYLERRRGERLIRARAGFCLAKSAELFGSGEGFIKWHGGHIGGGE